MAVMVAEVQVTVLEVTVEGTVAVMVVNDGGDNGRGGGFTDVMPASPSPG